MLEKWPSIYENSFTGNNMDDGGVDRTVIDCPQNQLGQMADFPPLITF